MEHVVSHQVKGRGYGFGAWAEVSEFCPKTPPVSKYSLALVVALAYLAVPVGLFLAKVSIASSTMLLMYLVCAIVLLSSVGAYIVASLIRTMVLDRDPSRAHTESDDW